MFFPLCNSNKIRALVVKKMFFDINKKKKTVDLSSGANKEEYFI